MKQWCEVFVMTDAVYIFSVSMSTVGIALVTGPRFRVPLEAGPSLIGATVIEALGGSADGVPFPSDHRQMTKEMLAFAGRKSWKRFVTDIVRGGYVESDGPKALLTPFAKGARDSLLPIVESATSRPLEATAIGEWFVG